MPWYKVYILLKIRTSVVLSNPFFNYEPAQKFDATTGREAKIQDSSLRVMIPVLKVCPSTLSLQSVRHPYLLPVNSGAQRAHHVIMCWKTTARRTSRFGWCRVIKNNKSTKNKKPSQRSHQSLACFTVCLLTCFLPFSRRFSNGNCCLSSLVVGCCLLGPHSMFTHHSLCSASLRRLNHFLVILLSSFLTQILKSKLLSFFSCCWLLRTGTTFLAYSPFTFCSLDRLKSYPFPLLASYSLCLLIHTHIASILSSSNQ
jgi:hypothetical protein